MILTYLRTAKSRGAAGDQRVRGVSGGERKRVSIGVELIANPPLLFLDEVINRTHTHTLLSRYGRRVDGCVLAAHTRTHAVYSLSRWLWLVDRHTHTCLSVSVYGWIGLAPIPCPSSPNPPPRKSQPTSGLDAFQALSVMGAMQALARSGRTVVAAIHQPRSSIYDLLDSLVLVSEVKRRGGWWMGDACGC